MNNYSLATETTKEQRLKEMHQHIVERFYKADWRTDGSVESAKENKMKAEELIQLIIDDFVKHSGVHVSNWSSYIQADII